MEGAVPSVRIPWVTFTGSTGGWITRPAAGSARLRCCLPRRFPCSRRAQLETGTGREGGGAGFRDSRTPSLSSRVPRTLRARASAALIRATE